jgi:O-antigen ligase
VIKTTAEHRLSKLIITVLVFTSLAITPFITFDPFNPIKLLILTTVAGACLGLILLMINKALFMDNLFPILALLSFVLFIILSTIFAEQKLIVTLFGITGRNTGVLAYLALAILYLAALLISSENLAIKIAKSMIFVGVLTVTYCWVQILGLDPAPWSQENWVMSFFSNPNFVSSFLGLASAPAFAYLLNSSTQKKYKLFLLVYFLLVISTIYKTYSIQGLIVSGLVGSIVIYLKINSVEKLLKFRKYYISIIFIGITWLILDILQKTPGDSVIYKLSVSSRGDFWRASWAMGLDKPIFGWGLDSLRDRFELYRDATQAARGEGHMVGEIAHNVFLDLFVGGGFTLLFSYITIIIVSFFAVKNLVFRTYPFSVGFVTVLSVSVGYLVQAIISANHLGLAVWGWVSIGVLAGYQKNLLNNLEVKSVPLGKNKINIKSIKSRQKRVEAYVALSGLILGFASSLPLYLVNAKQQSATNNKNAEQIYSAALAWPQDMLKMCIFAERLKSGGYEAQALTIVREAQKFAPYSVVPLKILLTFSSLSPQEKNDIQRKIKQLDPYWELAENKRISKL